MITVIIDKKITPRNFWEQDGPVKQALGFEVYNSILYKRLRKLQDEENLLCVLIGFCRAE